MTPIGGSATPTGTVQFVEYVPFGPPLPLASATMNNGTATLDMGTLTAGSHNVMAIYMGDGAYNGSGSAALGVTGGGRATPSMGTNVPYPVLVSTRHYAQLHSGRRSRPADRIRAGIGGRHVAGSLTLVNGAASFSYMSSTPGVHQITAAVLGRQQLYAALLDVPGHGAGSEHRQPGSRCKSG